MAVSKNKLKSTSILVGVVAAGSALAMTPAWAQTAPPQAQEEAVLDEVVVTGSRIRRDPTTSPTPLQQISREEVLQSGQANVIDYLADIPALQNSFVPEDTTGNSLGTGGLSLVNLRNLGNARTLVLVDGRRHAGAAYFASSAVDIDTIPRLLIENVELITGGASAVYGADAVAGVVNFIQRRNIEGWEVDLALGEINSNGELNKRASVLWGGSAFDGRLKGYVSGEYEANEAVQDRDIRVFRRDPLIYQNDLDPGATPSDGDFDIMAGYGYQTINRPRGGALTLAHNVTPSPGFDPDIPAAACAVGGINANCFVYDPGFTFVFDNGQLRPIDFGTSRVPAGLNRTNTRGSRDGIALSDQVNAGDRLPEQEAWRFQTGGEFSLTSNVQAFGEFKYIDEMNSFFGSTPFTNILISTIAPGGQSAFQGAVNNIQVGSDNAYLSPAIRTLIQTNTRGGVLDARAVLRNNVRNANFRPQENSRETWRALAGLKGEFDQLSFLKDGNWEISYSRSRVEDQNDEPDTLDTERYMFAADAVVDAAGLVNGRPGEIVCRVRLNAANGINQLRGANSATTPFPAYTATDEAISQCQPFNVFGNDEIPDSARGYLLTEQSRGFTMEQDNALAFISGDLWDFWGAGAIGIAAGLEYRSESFGGYASPSDRPSRVILGNVYTGTPEESYNSTEAFIELQIPLLRDLPFVESLDVSGAYRYADYSLFGGQDVYSAQASWQVNPSLLFRGTVGTSIRIPSLNELYRSPAQTFVTIADNCSRDVIDATANATTRANRNANCAALGIPTDYFDPTPGGNTPGLNGPNPLLTPEESDSYTASIVFTPESWPNFNMVLDYYNIEITQAINSVNVTTLLNLCVDQAVLNTAACGQITRSPTTFDITSFIQGFFNYAKQTAEGIDFNARYRQDLQELTGRDWGELNLSLRGTYVISRKSFTDALNPGVFLTLNDTQGNPTVRYLASATWSKGPLALTWNADFQTSIELADKDIYKTNLDSRPIWLTETGDFWQHDVNFRYEWNDRVTLRGGVTNVFNAEPSLGALVGLDPFGFSAGGTVNQFDVFGRRFFVGVNARF